jgi:hypothetical protein
MAAVPNGLSLTPPKETKKNYYQVGILRLKSVILTEVPEKYYEGIVP